MSTMLRTPSWLDNHQLKNYYFSCTLTTLFSTVTIMSCQNLLVSDAYGVHVEIGQVEAYVQELCRQLEGTTEGRTFVLPVFPDSGEVHNLIKFYSAWYNLSPDGTNSTYTVALIWVELGWQILKIVPRIVV